MLLLPIILDIIVVEMSGLRSYENRAPWQPIGAAPIAPPHKHRSRRTQHAGRRHPSPIPPSMPLLEVPGTLEFATDADINSGSHISNLVIVADNDAPPLPQWQLVILVALPARVAYVAVVLRVYVRI
jgi:hypothetical protein